MFNIKDLINKKFGRLEVLKRVDDHIYPSGRRDIQYLCRCDCGSEITVLGIHLRSNHTKSCGCFRKDQTSIRKSTHKKSNTRLHNIWKNMKQRCYCKTNPDYKLYGSRGIDICEEWKNDFETFFKWAMQNGYDDNLSIDRIDVNKGYYPENCRWATQKEQCNNNWRNILIEHNGEIHTMKEWSEIIGIKYGTLQSRLNRGWNINRALEK